MLKRLIENNDEVHRGKDGQFGSVKYSVVG